DDAAHDVLVSFVLEGHLDHAVAVDTVAADVVVRGAGLSVQAVPDRFDEIALPRAVRSVDPDQSGRDLEFELLLVHPVVPEQKPLQQHPRSWCYSDTASATAASRYSWPRPLTRSRSNPVRSWVSRYRSHCAGTEPRSGSWSSRIVAA